MKNVEGAASLREDLRQAPGESPLAVGRFHAYSTQTVKNLPFWSPCLIWIQVGTKRLELNRQEIIGQADDLLLIPAGIRCQLENRPDHRVGEYRALAFELAPDDIEAIARPLDLALSPLNPSRIALCRPPPELRRSLQHLLAAIDNGIHPALARHRLREVLMHWVLLDPELWPLLFPRARSLTMHVQSIIARNPNADWTLVKLAQLLHRSVATLGRQLKEERTGLRAILDDVRLVKAFNLLQTTHASIDQVAQECGYQSTPRFSERFRVYFGLTPAQLRRTRQKQETETESDHV